MMKIGERKGDGSTMFVSKQILIVYELPAGHFCEVES